MRKVINNSLRSRGKNVSINVRAQSIEHDLDEREAARIPAEAIAKMVKARIKGITMRAADSTLQKRKAKGLSSTIVFRATGYLANGIAMAEDEPGRFQTIAPQGRLSPDAPWIIRRLLEIIDVNAQTIMQVPEVKKAVEETVKRMIKVRR
jgi:hypothetical protein